MALKRQGGLNMDRLMDAVDRCVKECTWKELSVLQLWTLALGVLLGLVVPGRNKRGCAWAFALIFAAACVPVLARLLPYVLDGRVAIADIYGEKQL